MSGGEPFLRDDLPDVVRVMREACPRARVVISTNGLATDRIVAAVALQRYLDFTPIALRIRDLAALLARSCGASLTVLSGDAPVK